MIESKDNLKNHFKTGTKPTEDNFGSLIDSLLHVEELNNLNLTKATEPEAKRGDANDRYMTPLGVKQAIGALTRLVNVPDLSAEVQAKIDDAISNLKDGVDTAYDTLQEIATEIKDNDSAISGILTALAGKLDTNKKATQTEVNTGTDDTKYITPKTLEGKNAISEIPRNSNFDNLTDTGYYHCSSNIGMSSMSNRPSNLAGLLEVFKLNNFIYQTWTNFRGGNIYKRGYYTDYTVTADKRWSDWVQMSTNTELQKKKDDFTEKSAFNKDFGTVAGTVAEGNHSHNEIKAQEIPRNSNFDNLTDTGYYHCSSNIDMLNMSNRPSNFAGFLKVFKFNNFIYQTWTNFRGGNIYKRGYYTDHTVTADKRWSKWVQMSTKNNTPTVYLGNANAPTNPGNYRIGDIYLRNNSTRYMYMCNYNTNGTAKQWHRFDNL